MSRPFSAKQTNLVSPGGALKKQTISGVTPGTLYQNLTIVTPAGPAVRKK